MVNLKAIEAMLKRSKSMKKPEQEDFKTDPEILREIQSGRSARILEALGDDDERSENSKD